MITSIVLYLYWEHFNPAVPHKRVKSNLQQLESFLVAGYFPGVLWLFLDYISSEGLNLLLLIQTAYINMSSVAIQQNFWPWLSLWPFLPCSWGLAHYLQDIWLNSPPATRIYKVWINYSLDQPNSSIQMQEEIQIKVCHKLPIWSDAISHHLKGL